MGPKKIIFVVCEGSSDAKYLQWLSSFFKSNDIPLVLKPYSAGTGDFPAVRAKYKEARQNASRDHSKPEVIVWVDKDIYARNDRKNGTKYENEKSLPDFRFSYMNYEDFLTLHDNEQLEKWTVICRGRYHFSFPMKSDDYLPLFREHIFQAYRKGTLPEEFVRLDDSEKATLIRTMLTNNKKAEASGSGVIHCDFASCLATWLGQIKDTTSDREVADFIGGLLP